MPSLITNSQTRPEAHCCCRWQTT